MMGIKTELEESIESSRELLNSTNFDLGGDDRTAVIWRSPYFINSNVPGKTIMSNPNAFGITGIQP